jgi:cobalt/nickel transport system ATP-binding protein
VIVATHDVDFAVAWADELCVLHAGELAYQGLVTDHEAVCRVLAELELGLPVVYELFAALRSRGLVRGETPPRTRAELMSRLTEDKS